LSIVPRAWSQEPDAARPAEAAKASDAAKAESKPFREQTIYIPYTKLREVFEREGRGVFVPYDKFQELWKAAREKDAPPIAGAPPVKALITEAENEAVVEKEVVRVTAKLKIDLVTEGWIEVPLRLSDAVILSAKIGNDAARLVPQPNGGYKLLVENKEKKGQQIELNLEYAKAFSKSPGRNTVSFEAPQAPVNRWKVHVPESGVKVNIEPLIAASEVPPDKAADKKASETVLLAFVGAAPIVKIDWTPKAEGASGLDALASVEVQQEVNVEEGLLRTKAQLKYTISRAELTQLVIEVPADQKVINLFDANIRQWSVEKADPVQKITAQLFEPARESQTVTLELEKLTGEAPKTEVSVPVIKALGAARQQGIVVVRVAGSLRAEAARRTGLLQLDAAELPPALARGRWDLSYRYAALPFELALTVVKVKPRVLVDQLVEAYLEPEQITLDLLAIYTIERAGLFELSLDIPAGYDVRQVRGQAAAGAAAVTVDSHHIEGDAKTRLVVNLAHQALGKVGLFVELQKRLQDANLLSPTGKASEVAVAIPRVAPEGIERHTGRLVLYAPESLRANPTKSTGLRDVSFSEAFDGIESTRAGRFPQLRPVLAFAFTQEPVDLVLSAERRKPQITVGQLLVARVEAGVVKYNATFNYDVRYSGVKSLRIDVPAALAPDIRNLTSSIPEKPIDPPPADLAPDYVAWRFTGESEMLGQFSLQLSWERRLEKLEVGKSVDLNIPHLQPRDVDRAWGQIVLVKAETIDVKVKGEPSGLRPIDPQHDLMPGASVPDAALALEFHDDWKLDVTATRYQLESLKRTSIERAVVRMVVTRSDQIAVQAIYRLRSAQQRLMVKLPEGATFDNDPLRLNGAAITLERGDKNLVYAPLVGRSSDEPLVLELRYTQPGNGSLLVLPEFPVDPSVQPEAPAVQKVHLCVYLPEEQALLGARGPWTDEFRWVSVDWGRKIPAAYHSEHELINKLSEGIACQNNLVDGLQTDGRLYVYSTLQPAAGQAGALRLTAFNENGFHALVFVIIAIAGVALISHPAGDRLLALGIYIIGLVLIGVFMPTFSTQLMDGAFWFAMFLVLLMWAVWFLARVRPRRVTPAPIAPEVVAVAAEPPPAASPPNSEQSGDRSSTEEPKHE